MDPTRWRFTPEYREHLRLQDGTHVELRCVRPGDAALLRDAFTHLSSDSRLSRFHMVKEELSEAEVRYLTQLDGLDHFALGAVGLDGGQAGRGLGVARFIRDPERPHVAEAAFTVVDEAQGRGLGRVLVARLVEAARERHVQRFECTVLRSNLAMRRLLEPLGAVCRPQGGGTLLYDVPLRPAAPLPVPAPAA